jgi:hypothetical protein
MADLGYGTLSNGWRQVVHLGAITSQAKKIQYFRRLSKPTDSSRRNEHDILTVRSSDASCMERFMPASVLRLIATLVPH